MENKGVNADKNKYESSRGRYQGTPFQIRISDLLDPDKHPEYSQTELASKLSVTPQAVQQYNSGSTYPSLDKIEKIADYFKVSVDYLLGRTEVKTPVLDARAACEYTGLSEKAVEILHNITESLNRSDTVEVAIPSTLELHTDRYIRLNMKYSLDGEMQPDAFWKYISTISAQESIISFLSSLIESPDLKEMSTYLNADLINPPGEENLDGDKIDKLIRLGQLQQCSQVIQKISETISKKDKQIVFSHLCALEDKAEKCMDEYVESHEYAKQRQKIIDGLMEGLPSNKKEKLMDALEATGSNKGMED